LMATSTMSAAKALTDMPKPSASAMRDFFMVISLVEKS
jgi:hypothetical protein